MRLDLQEYPLVAIVEMHVRNIEGTESLDDYIHQGCQERPWQPALYETLSNRVHPIYGPAYPTIPAAVQ
jgi:hypothetical protein